MSILITIVQAHLKLYDKKFKMDEKLKCGYEAISFDPTSKPLGCADCCCDHYCHECKRYHKCDCGCVCHEDEDVY